MDASDIKLEDIDFASVAECTSKQRALRHVQLLEDDGGYYEALLKEARKKLLQVDPRTYNQRYGVEVSKADTAASADDLWSWVSGVKNAADSAKPDNPAPARPVRGQEDLANVPGAAHVDRRPHAGASDELKRDKATLQSFYRRWEQFAGEEVADLEREDDDADRPRVVDLDDCDTSRGAVAAVGEEDPFSHLSKDQRAHLADHHKNLGNECFAAKELEDAAAAYRRSLVLVPAATVFANLALVELRRDAPTDALRACIQAIRLDGKNVKAWHRKGKALELLGRREDSIAAIQQALHLAPSNERIMQDLRACRRGMAPSSSTRQQREAAAKKADEAAAAAGRAVQEEANRHVEAAESFRSVAVIEDDSDDESSSSSSSDEDVEEVVVKRAAAPPAEPKEEPKEEGFSKVVVLEESSSSDAESEDEEVVVVKRAPEPPAVESAGAAKSGFKRILIAEHDSSSDEELVA